MIQAIPSTKYNELMEVISTLLASGDDLEKSSFEYRRLEKECRAVRQVNASEGWTLLGMLACCAWDEVEAINAFSNAERFGWEHEDSMNALSSYIRLGQFRQAARLVEKYGSPDKGFFNDFIHAIASCGMFRTFSEWREKALKMEIDVDSMDGASMLALAAEIAKLTGLSDAKITEHLDVAGKVLRRHKLNPSMGLFATNQTEVFSGITTFFAVALPSDQIFELNIELAQEEEKMGIVKHPSYDVVFTAEPK